MLYSAETTRKVNVKCKFIQLSNLEFDKNTGVPN